MNNTQILSRAWVLALGIGLGGLGAFGASSWLGSSAGAAHAEQSAASEDGHGHEEEAGAEHDEAPAEEGLLTLSEAQIQAAGIQLVAAAPQAIGRSLVFPAQVGFDEDRTSHVVPRVPGVVEAVRVDLGQWVKKGQVLAVIASQQISDQRSEQAAAQRRLELARSTYERERQLWQERISAEQDFLQARQALQDAEIALDNARQKVSAMSGNAQASGGNRYELRAPFDGVVVEKHLALGEVVSESSNAFTLSDLSRVWVTFGVAPKDLEQVRVGRAVTVSATELNSEASGSVAYVGSLLGEQTRAATVRVALDNPQGAWRPGLFVSVKVAIDRQQVAVSVPEAALHSVEDRPTVFVRSAEGFRATPVQTGRRADGLVEITQGLPAGTQIASAGSFILKSELGKASAQHAH
jgi:cobalt-zinc-cadmium efflux system membrane fusion protein